MLSKNQVGQYKSIHLRKEIEFSFMENYEVLYQINENDELNILSGTSHLRVRPCCSTCHSSFNTNETTDEEEKELLQTCQ